MSGRWLVNDALGQLGERTLWHDLKETFNLNFESKNYEELPKFIEDQNPDLVVRNATYFRPLNVKCPQIVLVQDIVCCELEKMQREVIAKSTVAVYNSIYTRDKVSCPSHVASRVIPLGVDSNFWYPKRNTIPESEKDPKRVLWIGSSHTVKGFELFRQIIEQSTFEFLMITKDDFHFNHPRVMSYGRQTQESIREIASFAGCLLCTSESETQHLAGIEAAFCGLPIVAPNIGIYYDTPPQARNWGLVVDSRNPQDFISCIRKVLDTRKVYSPREAFLCLKLDKQDCMNSWGRLIRDVEDAH